ncbi:MAG: hypothetical protein ACK551_02555 [Vampirovibrionales bacterium]
MKLKSFQNAYNMTEILVSLLILGVLIAMSFQLLNPNKSDTVLGRKVDTYLEHLGSVHKRIVSTYGVTPLNVDLDGDGCATEEQTNFRTGVPNFVRSFDSVASFRQDVVPNTVNGRATFLQYPSNIRVWLYPEEFTWMQATIAEFEGLGYNRREFMIVEAVPGGTMTGLPKVSETGEAKVLNSDVVLIHIDDQTGKIETVADLATKHWGSDQRKYVRTFYDRYKDSIN